MRHYHQRPELRLRAHYYYTVSPLLRADDKLVAVKQSVQANVKADEAWVDISVQRADWFNVHFMDFEYPFTGSGQ